jgi:hypothetical protein
VFGRGDPGGDVRVEQAARVLPRGFVDPVTGFGRTGDGALELGGDRFVAGIGEQVHRGAVGG